MKYILEGNPIPLKRPRFKGRTVYDAQRIEKISAQQQLDIQHRNRPMYEGALLLTVTFYLQIPKKSSHNNKLCNRFHIYKPDLSNLIKFLEDVGTGILYKDDSLIAHIDAAKRYDHIARTEFEISPIKQFCEQHSEDE